MLKSLWVAVSFLTRLCPYPEEQVDENILLSSVAWYPVVGLFIGLVCVFPFYFGLFEASPLFQGWAWVLLNLWLTRGLHLDGLADVADAWGSNAKGEKFQAILKDSRIGAFGVMALCVGLGGIAIGGAYNFENKLYLPLLFAPLISRSVLLILPLLCKVHSGSFLGKFVAEAASFKLLCLHMFLAILALFLCFGFVWGAFVLMLLGIMLWSLLGLARREQGFNGDFLGSAIVLSELIVLSGSLFAY